MASTPATPHSTVSGWLASTLQTLHSCVRSVIDRVLAGDWWYNLVVMEKADMKIRSSSWNLTLAAFLTVTIAGCVPETEDEGESFEEPYPSEGIEAWGQSYETRETGKSDNPGCSGVLVPDRSGFGGRVSLTFDDGPNPTTTNQVLDTLADHEIKAAFFINGRRVDNSAAQQTLKRIIDEGHILANHSQNHKNLRTLDLSRVESEVDRTHQIIEDAGIDPEYFRFPYGSSSCSTMDLVESFGYRSTGWHTDSADWCFANGRGGVGYCDPDTFAHVPNLLRDDMPGLVMEQVQRNNGGVVLFHDVHSHTANSLDQIIRNLKEEDFSFVNIDDVSTYPLLNGDDLEDLPWVGSACQEDAECEFGDGTCNAYQTGGMTTGFCVLEGCEGYCEDFPGRAPTFCVSLDGGESGSCVSQAHDRNDNCAELPGTVPTERTRYVGSSSAPASTAEVCLPAE